MRRSNAPLSRAAARIVLLALAASVETPATATGQATPLAIGETFTMASSVLDETRRINVYFPPGFTQAGGGPLPVLFMPDGGIDEDFLHVAGLVQVLVGNGTMRPFLLVGIENTERRRDMTGPTDNESDRQIAPRVGGSGAFRRFMRHELMPEVRRRYRTTEETAVVGESLAGLFVVETFLLEPDLFDTYVAFDPSLWWNDAGLVSHSAALISRANLSGRTIFIATSEEAQIAELSARLVHSLASAHGPQPRVLYEPRPDESHRTIYHPAALKAFGAVLGAPLSKKARPPGGLRFDNVR
jgi:predicted alpha/beta superfamily hydrolase